MDDYILVLRVISTHFLGLCVDWKKFFDLSSYTQGILMPVLRVRFSRTFEPSGVGPLASTLRCQPLVPTLLRLRPT